MFVRSIYHILNTSRRLIRASLVTSVLELRNYVYVCMLTELGKLLYESNILQLLLPRSNILQLHITPSKK